MKVKEATIAIAVMRGRRRQYKGKERRWIAEEVGGMAAKCTAICCCCLYSLVNLVILALYKVPAGLCKKASKRRRLLKMKKAFILHNNSEGSMMNGIDYGPSKLGLVAEVPAGLCKKAWKRCRLFKMKKKAFILHNNSKGSMMNGIDYGPLNWA
nr:hypothetical protein CFP56_05664 [Quercus suber]